MLCSTPFPISYSAWQAASLLAEGSFCWRHVHLCFCTHARWSYSPCFFRKRKGNSTLLGGGIIC